MTKPLGIGSFACYGIYAGLAFCKARRRRNELENMFFNSWGSLLRLLVVGALAYVSLVIFLRFSGNRTLAKMNAFDLIVTVALGSILATVLLSKTVALAEGVLAFALLIGLQFAVTWSSVRAPWVRRWVTGEPHILLYHGQVLPVALKHARVAEDEVLMAVRSAGLASLNDAEAVVLETDGSFSVINRGSGDGNPSLKGVNGPQPNSEFAESDVASDSAHGGWH